MTTRYRPADAALLLRALLPAAVADAVSWEPLRREPASFIDEKGADHHGDLLFRAQLRAGRPEHVFFLVEHQSTVDPTMPLRMARYQLQIWRHVREGTHPSRRRNRRKEPLPPVIAVLVSHAPGGWTAASSFEGLFDPAVLALPGLAPLVAGRHARGDRPLSREGAHGRFARRGVRRSISAPSGAVALAWIAPGSPSSRAAERREVSPAPTGGGDKPPLWRVTIERHDEGTSMT